MEVINTNESICSQCAQHKLNCKDCCTSPFEGKNPGFILTLPDIARIVKRTKLNPDLFCRIVEHTDDDYDEDEEIEGRIGDMIEFNNKTILMNGDGKCSFLGKKGCNIFDIRPSMCRIFPFWFEEDKDKIKITIEHEDTIEEDECLLTKTNYKSENIPHLLSLIKETEESMTNTIKKFIIDLEVHDKYKHELEKKSILQVLMDNNLIERDLKLNSDLPSQNLINIKF